MFIDLSGVRSVRWSHAAGRKNVLGPILALPQPSAAFCEPEKCSWTYPEFAPLVGHTLHAGRMFLDLSGIHVSSRSHSVNLKNVHGPIWNSPCSWLHSLDPNNVLKTAML